jgi:hypothetical protein
MKRLLKIIFIASLLIPIASLAITIKGTGATRTIHGTTYTDFDFSLASTSRQDIVSGATSGTTNQKDLILNTVTSATLDNAANLQSTPITSGFLSTNYTSLDTAIATVDSNGRVTRVSDGTARINSAAQVSGNNGFYTKLTKQISVPVSRLVGQTTKSFNSYVTGSLGKNASDQIDTKIAGKTGSTGNTELFSTQNHATATYVWNTSNWLYGVDMTMISPWNTDSGVQKAGVLVSPRTIIIANHFNISPGNTIRFIKQDGTVVTRTVSAVGNVTGTDIYVEVLDSDVPAGIGFAKILPSNFINYLPSVTSTTTIPVVGLFGGGNDGVVIHPNKTATVREINILGAFNYYQRSASTTRSSFYIADVVGGDSGNPFFALINGALVLLDADYSGTGGAGPFVSSYITQINALMSSLGDSGHTLTTVDLSGFTSY